MHHKNRQDARRAGAECAQDRNVSAFVRHGHHQGSDQIKSRHRHDESEDDEHHAFFDLYGGKPCAVLSRPITHDHFATQKGGEFISHRARIVDVLNLETNTAGALDPKNALRVLNMHERQSGVVFVVTRIKNA